MGGDINKEELDVILEKLDTLKTELLRLRAMLTPEEEATSVDKKEIGDAEQEIKDRLAVSFENYLEDLGG